MTDQERNNWLKAVALRTAIEINVDDEKADIIRQALYVAWECGKSDASPADRAGGGGEPGSDEDLWVAEADTLARDILTYVTVDQFNEATARGKSVSSIVYGAAERIFALGQAHVAAASQGTPEQPGGAVDHGGGRCWQLWTAYADALEAKDHEAAQKFSRQMMMTMAARVDALESRR